MNITILSDRWIEPIYGRGYETAVKGMAEWCDLNGAKLNYAKEMFFAAKKDDRLGYLLEYEFEDGYTPSQSQIDRFCRLTKREGGEFTYVQPGDENLTWYGCAAFWAFFPGRFVDLRKLERVIDVYTAAG